MKRFLIFSGYNQRAIIAFVRTLETKRLPYSIVACTEDDPILGTWYGRRVDLIRDSHNLEINNFCELIARLQKKYISDRFIFLPSSEYLNRFVLNNRKKIEVYRIDIPLVDELLYTLISDKASFESLCKSYDIAVPERINRLEFPIVAKCSRYFSLLGKTLSPVIIRNEEEYGKFREENNEKDFYLQRYIKGESIYLFCYFYSDGTVDLFSQRNLIQQDEGKSIIAAEYSDFWKTNEAQKYVKLLRDNNFSGLIMIEVRKENDKYYMIEANPRLWGPSQFMVDSNANLFESMLFDLGVIQEKKNIKTSYFTDKKYYWRNGLVEDMNKNKISVLLDDHISIDFIEREFGKYDIYKRQDTYGLYDNTDISNCKWRNN